MMLTFKKTRNAVDFGHEMVAAWIEKRKEFEAELQLGIRIGINWGGVEFFEVSGIDQVMLCSDAINRAQRIEGAPKIGKDDSTWPSDWPTTDICLVNKNFVQTMKEEERHDQSRMDKAFDKATWSFGFEKKKAEGVDAGKMEVRMVIGCVPTDRKLPDESDEEKMRIAKIARATQQFDAGVKAYNEGKFKEAADCFEQADKLRPNDPATLYNWGVSLYDIDDYKTAIEKYGQADKLRPDDPDTLNNWGVALNNIGEHEAAIEKYKQANELRPDHPNTLIGWGMALDKLGDHEAAAEKFKQAKKLNGK
jgi:tetratricopeptide (TPR) repeat protein